MAHFKASDMDLISSGSGLGCWSGSVSDSSLSSFFVSVDFV